MLAEEALVDLLGRERGRERQVAACEPLGEAEQVGRDALVLAREHPARAAEAGGHLVEDQEHAVAVAELADRAQVARRVNEHPGRALDERLHDHGRDLAAVLSQQARSISATSPGSAFSVSNRSGS